MTDIEKRILQNQAHIMNALILCLNNVESEDAGLPMLKLKLLAASDDAEKLTSG